MNVHVCIVCGRGCNTVYAYSKNCTIEQWLSHARDVCTWVMLRVNRSVYFHAHV